MSVPKYLQDRGKILDDIMRHHREQLPKIKADVPLADLRAWVQLIPPPLDFHAAITKPGVSLIAECKKASPSKGLIVPRYDPIEIALDYQDGGASCISVLTDARHFQGSLEDLRNVRESVKLPILRKDFMFDPYHIYESRVAGADCILLIAAVLGDADLAKLMALSTKLGMSTLVEVHTDEELDRMLALDPQPKIIGINNRDLQTFKVDFENTARLRKKIPEHIAVVGESGLRTTHNVRHMKGIGVDAILVGEALVKNDDTRKITRAFVLAGR
ncbi:MAG: indole-3-glycerol phosphate synthase [Cellvibrionaceae bacterium]|jgi:indole-3-glycerol phosphate synthase